MKSRTEYGTYLKVAGVEGANALHVTVFYAKGGINYWNYKTDPRGYYVGLNPVTVKEGEAGGFSSVSFVMGQSGGFKVFLKPTERMSGTTLKALAQQVFTKDTLLALVAAYESGQPSEAHALLAGFKAPELQKEVAA